MSSTISPATTVSITPMCRTFSRISVGWAGRSTCSANAAAMVSAILGRLLGWRTLFWLSGTVEDFNRQANGWKDRLGYSYMWLLLRLVDRLVTGPETMQSYYRRTYGLPAGKVALLYNDVDLSAVEAAGPLSDSGPPRVLMVHRLSPVRETGRYFPALLAALGEFASKRE